MPFEPLQTDEKIEGENVHEKSMDDHMLTGCTGFVGCSIGAFLIGVWPFLVLGSKDPPTPDLLYALVFGLIPALIFGGYVSRRFGLAAACGFIGGAMALGVFMYLIASRISVAIFLASGPRHFYSPVLVFLIPVFWVLLSLAVAYGFIAKSELRIKKP